MKEELNIKVKIKKAVVVCAHLYNTYQTNLLKSVGKRKQIEIYKAKDGNSAATLTNKNAAEFGSALREESRRCKESCMSVNCS